MFYHPHDNFFTTITKHLVALMILFTMVAVAIYAVLDDTKIPQKEITLVIDIKDNVNVCAPEDDDVLAQKSFFNF